MPSDFLAESETRDRFHHFAQISTRWRDNDVYGHVNNAVYNSWIDTTAADFLVSEGVISPATSTIVGFVVESFCQFRAAVAYPEVVEGGLRVGHLGRTSARYEVGIFRQGVEEAAAVGYLVHVFVDRETQRPVEMPDNLRAALTKLLV